MRVPFFWDTLLKQSREFYSTPSFLIFWVIPGFFFMCDQDFTLIKGREGIENRSVNLCRFHFLGHLVRTRGRAHSLRR